MRNPINFPPLQGDEQKNIAQKLEERGLNYPELIPLVAHLAYECPRTLVLTPSPSPSDTDDHHTNALERELLFHYAAGAMHENLLSGELPTSPLIKYSKEVLSTENEHEHILKKAATVAELFLSHKVVVYADHGIDQEMKEVLATSKALEVEVEFRLLNLPEYWANGRAPVQNLELVKREYKDLPPTPLPELELSYKETQLIAEKFETSSLKHDDVFTAALFLHENEHVVVESPYAPNYSPEDDLSAFSLMDLSINMSFAYRAQRELLLKGKIPSASHTEFTHPGILDDTNTHERVLGIAAGLAKTLFFDVSHMYDNRDISSGMKKGAEFAKQIKRPVLRYRVSDFDARYWRGSFEDYIEEEFKTQAEGMEAGFALINPEREDPEFVQLVVAHTPWESLKRATLYMSKENLRSLSFMLPKEMMNHVRKARAEALREERNQEISHPTKPFAIDQARA